MSQRFLDRTRSATTRGTRSGPGVRPHKSSAPALRALYSARTCGVVVPAVVRSRRSAQRFGGHDHKAASDAALTAEMTSPAARERPLRAVRRGATEHGEVHPSGVGRAAPLLSASPLVTPSLALAECRRQGDPPEALRTWADCGARDNGSGRGLTAPAAGVKKCAVITVDRPTSARTRQPRAGTQGKHRRLRNGRDGGGRRGVSAYIGIKTSSFPHRGPGRPAGPLSCAPIRCWPSRGIPSRMIWTNGCGCRETARRDDRSLSSICGGLDVDGAAISLLTASALHTRRELLEGAADLADG
jgi:hypothetical protein